MLNMTAVRPVGFTLEFLKVLQEKGPARDAEIADKEMWEARAAKDRRYRRAVPERYWTESLDTYEADTDERGRALELARNFVSAVSHREFRTLILLGAVGTGKTHLACGAIRECGGAYEVSAGIAERLRRAKSFKARGAETGASVVSALAVPPLLVVDEIGRGSDTNDERYAIYHAINARYEVRKPLVLVSNFSRAEFLDYIGSAAADRLTESAVSFVFGGESYRPRLRAGNI